MKKIMSCFLIFGYATLQGFDDQWWQDMYKAATETTIAAGTIAFVGATILYATVHTNETVTNKVKDICNQIDTCQDLLPPDSWTDTKKAYFACYLKSKFSLTLSDINETTSQIVDKHIALQKKNLETARQLIEFRGRYFQSMQDLNAEIDDLDRLLERASLNAALYYRDFFLSQQVENLHNLLRNIDNCKDLLPYACWDNDLEAYFEHYLKTRLSMKLVAIDEKVMQCLQDYVLKHKLNLFAAHKSALYLSKYYDEMKEVLVEINEIEAMLEQANFNLQIYYKDFLLVHQILNFYEKLPTHDTKWCTTALLPEKENRIVKWIRRILLSHKQFPLVAFKEMVFRDLKIMHEYINSRSFVIRYPLIHAKLLLYRDSLETAYDILLGTAQYFDEKDDKHKADLLSIEESKDQLAKKDSWIAEQAVEQAAWAMRQAARIEQDLADAQLRHARALEEANRLAIEKKKEEASRRK